MMGKHHVMVNTGIFLTVAAIKSSWNYHMTHSFLFQRPGVSIENLSICLVGLLCYCGFVVGTLLPDIDSKQSILGRYVHLPLEHRTWTHSVIALLILLPVWFVGDLGFSLWFGYFCHLLGDSFSAAGICWRYPFVKYKVYPSGAKVVPGHKMKLYHTGKVSETWFVAFCLVLCSLVSLLALCTCR